MDSVEDPVVLLGLVLETCSNSKDAVDFLHDVVFPEWKVLLENLCRSSADHNIMETLLTLQVITTRLKSNDNEDGSEPPCPGKLKNLLSVATTPQFLSFVTDAVSSLRRGNNDANLGELVEYLHLFCGMVASDVSTSLMLPLIRQCHEAVQGSVKIKKRKPELVEAFRKMLKRLEPPRGAKKKNAPKLPFANHQQRNVPNKNVKALPPKPPPPVPVHPKKTWNLAVSRSQKENPPETESNIRRMAQPVQLTVVPVANSQRKKKKKKKTQSPNMVNDTENITSPPPNDPKPVSTATAPMPVLSVSNANAPKQPAAKAVIPTSTKNTVASAKNKKNKKPKAKTNQTSNSSLMKKRKEEEIEEDKDPPHNFREVSIIPTLTELLEVKTPFLRPNKIYGPYKSAEHYLGVQFDLLKEDFVRPLRRGIQQFVKNGDPTLCSSGGNSQEKTGVRVYKDVEYLRTETVTFHKSTNYLFQLPRYPWRRVNWAKSKRLLPGSLVMLTADNCKTAHFATTVAPPFDYKKAREEGNLNHTRQELKNGIVRLSIESKGGSLKAGTKYLMFECEAFFEAYRYNLDILQSMEWGVSPQEEGGNIIFTKFIVGASNIVDPPRYLAAQVSPNAQYRLPTGDASMEFPVDPLNPGSWNSAEIQHGMKLDSDQYDALKTALTSELSVIQGPPGTGKTYVGLQIVKTLLHNKYHGALPKSPFLVLCYTNHALDQFLELLLGEFPALKLVRVGGQSKSDLVQGHTLAEHRKNLKALRHAPEDSVTFFDKRLYKYSNFEINQNRKEGSAFRDMKRYEAEYQQVEEEVQQLRKPDGILNFHEMKLQNTLQSLTGNGLWRALSTVDWLGITPDLFHDPNYNVKELLTRLLGLDEEALEKVDKILAEESELELDLPWHHAEEYDMRELLEHRLLDEGHQFELLSHLAARLYYPVSTVSGCILLTADALKNFEFAHSQQQRRSNNDDDVTSPQLLELYQFAKNLVFYYENRTKFLKVLCKLREDGCLNLPKVSHYFENQTFHNIIKGKQKRKERDEEINRILDQVSFPERWAIYFYVLEKALHFSTLCREEVNIQLCRAKQQYTSHRQSLDGYIVQSCDIIGMTTTGAAKMHGLLEIANPEIVIVEEAAEILESHIVTALTENCKQLILIGDHLQLRPSANVYELWSKFRLNVSLFERMLLNGIPVCTLKTQHRMRPEIASLIVGPIYQELVNHPNVYEYPSVPGVATNLFFVNHTYPEETDMDIMSKTNLHEALFIAALCEYLLQQKCYHPHQITILTTYTGQMFLIKKHMSSSCHGVRVTSVDNYQGEENDIILLSLVRSNPENIVGFVGIKNRICVALSRARHALFAIGNMLCLANASQTWNMIYWKLKNDRNIGPSLPLKTCENHSQFTLVNSGASIKTVVKDGCSQRCGAPLPCGHLCQLKCGHVFNSRHINVQCMQPCTKVVCQRGHRCKGVCGELCPPCSLLRFAELPCGHRGKVPCNVDPKEVKCYEKTEKKLACKYRHTATVDCFMDPQFVPCPVEINRQLMCGHLQIAECGRPLDQILCTANTEKQLPCGHWSIVACYENVELVKCSEKVRKELPCGHQSKLIRCSAHLGLVLCPVMVDVVMPNCQHEQRIQCSSRSNHKCGANCDQLLSCGHACRLTCHLTKDPKHKEYKCKQKCNRVCEYGHPCKFGHECHQNCPPCEDPVEVMLNCGHEAEIHCSRQKDNQWCYKKILKMLSCGHEQQVPCQGEIDRQKCMFPVKNCQRVCDSGHLCSSDHACHEPCPPCDREVEKILECEHSAKMLCHESITDYNKCKEKCRIKCTSCSQVTTIKCAKRNLGLCKTCEADAELVGNSGVPSHPSPSKAAKKSIPPDFALRRGKFRGKARTRLFSSGSTGRSN